MQENNMSVFSTVTRNEEIANFMRLLNLAREIFKQELTMVEIMPGGLTNKNSWAVTEDDTQIIIHLAGQGIANYINRPGKKYNTSEIVGLDIAPEIYYYDPKTSSQTVEYIDTPTMHPVDFQTQDEILVKVGAVIRRYHDGGLEFEASFDPIAEIDRYKAILNEHSYGERYEGWERIVEALEHIRTAYAKQSPCRIPYHNDALTENFMLQDEQMRVINQGCGGMNSGYYDIARVCVENPLDARCKDVFFRAYCGGEPSEEAKACLLINKFPVTSHWSTWSLVQIRYGKDMDFYQEYGRTRTVQAYSFLDDPSFSRSLILLGG